MKNRQIRRKKKHVTAYVRVCVHVRAKHPLISLVNFANEDNNTELEMKKKTHTINERTKCTFVSVKTKQTNIFEWRTANKKREKKDRAKSLFLFSCVRLFIMIIMPYTMPLVLRQFWCLCTLYQCSMHQFYCCSKQAYYTRRRKSVAPNNDGAYFLKLINLNSIIANNTII